MNAPRCSFASSCSRHEEPPDKVWQYSIDLGGTCSQLLSSSREGFEPTRWKRLRHQRARPSYTGVFTEKRAAPRELTVHVGRVPWTGSRLESKPRLALSSSRRLRFSTQPNAQRALASDRRHTAPLREVRGLLQEGYGVAVSPSAVDRCARVVWSSSRLWRCGVPSHWRPFRSLYTKRFSEFDEPSA